MSNNAMMSSPRSISITHPTPPIPVTPPPINIPLPEKMEIRVVEYVKADRIVKVELQYRMWNYDQFGYVVSTTDWEAVERVRIEME